MTHHTAARTTSFITTRIAAFGLAAVVTLSMLSGIDTLAVQEHAGAAMASSQTAPAQKLANAAVHRARA